MLYRTQQISWRFVYTEDRQQCYGAIGREVVVSKESMILDARTKAPAEFTYEYAVYR